MRDVVQLERAILEKAAAFFARRRVTAHAALGGERIPLPHELSVTTVA